MASAAAALASLSVDECKHPCWGCGAAAPPPNRKPFQQCLLCVDQKYAVSARFCTPACMSIHWPRHVEWHAGKDAQIESMAASNQDEIVTWRLQAAENVATATDEYVT